MHMYVCILCIYVCIICTCIITDFFGPALLFQQGCILSIWVKENSNERRTISFQQSCRPSLVFGLSNAFYTGISAAAKAVTELLMGLCCLDEVL